MFRVQNAGSRDWMQWCKYFAASCGVWLFRARLKMYSFSIPLARCQKHWIIVTGWRRTRNSAIGCVVESPVAVRNKVLSNPFWKYTRLFSSQTGSTHATFLLLSLTTSFHSPSTSPPSPNIMSYAPSPHSSMHGHQPVMYSSSHQPYGNGYLGAPQPQYGTPYVVSSRSSRSRHHDEPYVSAFCTK
jgi:hypothetical protein